MFDGMGIEWASTLLGCFAFCLVPIPVIFYLYGKKLRMKSKFAPTMAPKKLTEEDGSSDEEMEMSALHATRSRAHHDAVSTRTRTRTQTNGSGMTPPVAPQPTEKVAA